MRAVVIWSEMIKRILGRSLIEVFPPEYENDVLMVEAFAMTRLDPIFKCMSASKMPCLNENQGCQP